MDVVGDDRERHRIRWQLTVTQLMLWTVGVAVALKIGSTRFWAVEALHSYFLAPPTTNRIGVFYAWGLEIVTVPLYGITVAALMQFWLRHWKSRQLPRLEPGHWILICSGSSMILSLSLVIAGARRDSFVEVAWGLSAAIWFGSAEAIIEPKVWRFCFLTLGLRDASIAIAGLLTRAFAPDSWWSGVVFACCLFSLLALTGFVAAVLQDLQATRRRDALHWLGVAISLVVPLHIICHFAGFRILTSI